GVAEVEKKPAFGISNLRAMALFGKKGLRAVFLDARRGDVFSAVYNERLEALSPDSVAKAGSWVANYRTSEYELLCPDPTWLRNLGGEALSEIDITQSPAGLAGAVAQCAEIDFLAGVIGDPASLDANYVRRSDAELFWRDR
ncbi:MAG: hypothetical protein ACJ8LM_17510, partial [Candidatus Udaeobacter sp.]